MKVFIIAAVSTDGFIGQTSDHLADWTGSEDKKLFATLTKQAGTVVMGSRTFATIGRALPGRRTIVYTTHPEMIRVANIETTAEDPSALLARLAAEGCTELAICGGTAIYDLFMQTGLVTELHVTIVPILFGSGLPLLKTPLFVPLQLLETRKFSDGSMYSHYKIAS